MPLDDNTLKLLESTLLKTRRLLATVTTKIENGDLNRDIMMTLLKRNRNIIDPASARYLLNNNVLSRDDFNECGIDYNFVDLVLSEEPTDPAGFDDFTPIETIAPNATEVYFWGMPASGKSCALGAVMSMANNAMGNDVMIQHACQGADYMNHLSNVFRHNGIYAYLPAGTAISNTYEMRFSLIRNEREHPLSLIDMSGELFQCLYKSRGNKVLGEDEQKAFDVLNRLLVEHASQNRKIHFFVIEYGAENSIIDGVGQDQYLGRAAEYMNELGVFNEYTDAIYIILTKADKAGVFGSLEEELDHYHNYMTQHYLGFYKALRNMCKRNSINGGRLEFIPFSIGDVCLRRMCRFNGEAATEILDYIVERSYYVERNKLGKIVRFLRN